MPPTGPAPAFNPMQRQAAATQAASPPVSLVDDIAEHTARTYGPELFAPTNRAELSAEADTLYRAGLLRKYLLKGADGWTPIQRYKYCVNRALVAFLVGAELGLLPLQAVRGIYFVEDQPYPSAKTLVGIIKKRAAICEEWVVEESTDVKCTITTKRRGSKAERLTVTIEQFAKLRDDKTKYGEPKRPPWTLYPSRMLMARCSSWLANQVYPDLTMGLYAAEEMGSAVFEKRYADLGTALVNEPVKQPASDDAALDHILDMVDDGEATPSPPVDAGGDGTAGEVAEPQTGDTPIETPATIADRMRAELANVTTVEQAATLMGRANEIADEGMRRAFVKEAAAKRTALGKGAT